MPVSAANSKTVFDALKEGGVRLISALPETWLVHLIRLADDDPEVTLVRLEDEGLLQAIPSGGFMVKAFSERDILDSIELRGTVTPSLSFG